MGCCSLECRRRSTLPPEIQGHIFGFRLRRDDVVEVGVDDEDSLLPLHLQKLIRLLVQQVGDVPSVMPVNKRRSSPSP